MLIRTIAHISKQAIPIVGIDNLGEGQIHRNLLRNTKLVKVNVRIRSDNRARREVHTLAHQVTTHTTSLGTETRLEGAERATRPLLGRLHSLDVIVHIGRHVILKESRVLVNHICAVTLVNLVANTVIRTQHINQLVSQIVLHALVIVHHNRGTHRQRRNCEDSTQHPVGASEYSVES